MVKLQRKYKIAIGVGAPLAILGIAAYAILAPPRQAPAYTGVRPNIVQDGNYASNSETVVINVSVAEYDAWASNAALEDLLPKQQGVPEVVSSTVLKGTWDDPGARRRVNFSDGHFLAEEVVANEKPRLFRYQIWGFTNYAKLAADYAVGEFIAEDDNGKTRLTWTYSFHKRSPLTGRFIDDFVKNTWTPYMAQSLEAMKRGAEAAQQQR